MGKLSHARMTRQRPNPPPLARLFREARVQLGLDQADLARQLQVAPRTLSRWEAGDAKPTLEWRELVVQMFDGIAHDTWLAIVKELRFPLSAALALCPKQSAAASASALASASAPPGATGPATRSATETSRGYPTGVIARASLDAVLRESAEEIDVTARELRRAVVAVLDEAARLGLAPARAAALIRGNDGA